MKRFSRIATLLIVAGALLALVVAPAGSQHVRERVTRADVRLGNRSEGAWGEGERIGAGGNWELAAWVGMAILAAQFEWEQGICLMIQGGHAEALHRRHHALAHRDPSLIRWSAPPALPGRGGDV